MAAPTSPNGDYIYQGANNSYYNLNNTSLDPSNNPDNAVGTLFTCHVGAKSSRSLSLSLDSVFTLSNPPVLATPSYLISLLKPSHAHESRWYRYGTMCELSRFMITRKVAIVIVYRDVFVRKALGMKYTPVQSLVGNFMLYPFPKIDVQRNHLFRIIQLPKRVYL